MNPIGQVANRRLVVVAAVALAASAAVATRLVKLSLVEQHAWLDAAERQQQRTVRLLPERGSLLDREGRELAVSVRAWSAHADPSVFASQREREDAAKRLAAVLDRSEAELLRVLSKDRYFVWLQRKLSPERRAAVEGLGIDGVAFVPESRRYLPHGELAAHVLGSVGVDNEGLEGIEFLLDEQVAGSAGRLLTMRDARGGHFLPEGLSYRPPTRGADVLLSIDSVIQHHAERALRAAVQRTRAKAGSIVLMFPGNGEIVALANFPTFQPNSFPTYPSHLRTNRAVASCYEPGSTFKIFVAAAALSEGVVGPDDLIDCGRGSIRVGRVRIRDHHPFDLLTVRDVLAKSSNVGAVRLGRATGAAALHDTLTRFGFGHRTGIDFPTESAGILRDVSDWTPLSLASISFGQEVACSALQLTTAAAAIANGGVLHEPRLVREIRHAGGRIEVPGRSAPRRVLREDVARELSDVLESVVETGTATLAAVPGHRIAGKTGTAQKIGGDGSYADGRYVASFVGWVPADDPAFVGLVVLDEPQGPQHGGDAAAPVFSEVARDVLRYLEVAPDRSDLATAAGSLNAAAVGDGRPS